WGVRRAVIPRSERTGEQNSDGIAIRRRAEIFTRAIDKSGPHGHEKTLAPPPRAVRTNIELERISERRSVLKSNRQSRPPRSGCRATLEVAGGFRGGGSRTRASARGSVRLPACSRACSTHLFARRPTQTTYRTRPVRCSP